jgi:signal transduction histidine kinase/CheY-like chemotaxis protein
MAQLKITSQLSQKILREIPVGIAIYDVFDGKIHSRYVSDGYFRMLGVSRRSRVKYYGENSIPTVYPADRHGLLEATAQAIGQNIPLNYRFRLLMGDGTYNWVSILGYHYPYKKGVERFFVAFSNINALKTQVGELETIANYQRLLVRLTQQLNEPHGYSSHLENIGKELGEYFGADRSYLFLLDDNGKSVSDAMEWCKEGVTSQKKALQKVELSFIDRWIQAFHKETSLTVSDIEEIKESYPLEYGIMIQQQVHSYAEAPLYLNGGFVGFVGLDNPSPAMIPYAGDCLQALGSAIASSLFREKNENQLRKLTEDLRASELSEKKLRQNYELALNESKLFLWDYDIVNHRITMPHQSPSLNSLRFGIATDTIENVPDSLIPFISPKDVPAFKKMFTDMEAGAKKVSCEILTSNAPGQNLFYEKISYTTHFDEKGKPVSATGIAQDITSRKMEEESYKDLSQVFARAIVGSVGTSYLNLTLNQCLNVQSPYPDVIKRQKAETAEDFFVNVGKDIFDSEVLKNYQRTMNPRYLLSQYKAGMKTVTFDYPVRFQNQVIHWMRGTVVMSQHPGSSEIEAVTYAIDIISQRKADDILKHITETELEYIATISVGTGEFEFFKRKLDVSFPRDNVRVPYFKRVDYVCQRHIAPAEQEDFKKALSLPTILEKLPTEDSIYTYSYRRIEDDGHLTCKQIRYSWVRKEAGEILVARTDVTETYLREQATVNNLRDALMEAEKANSAKTEFVSRISHDIRTPLGIITNMTDFAFQDIDDKAKLTDDLKKISASNTFLLSLINDVLDISKIDSGKIELKPEPYLFSDYISNVRNMLEPLCQEKGLHMEVKTSSANPAIMADHIRLNQITLNLLSNAVKYTPEGGTITFVAKDERRDDGQVDCLLEVKDTGIGMSEAFQKIMFEPFTQEFDNPLRDKTTKGTGLGLSIVKKLVDLFGGHLRVESALGKGTAITITFTTQAAQPAPDKETPAEEAKRKDDNGLSGKVLLAEDNEINQEIEKRMLDALGISVDCAMNGKEAVEAFKASAPGSYQAILMDIQMPIMNGYEATEKIRLLERPDAKTIPIIAMTADAFSAAVEHSKVVGMNAYITKPLYLTTLKETLSPYLAKKEEKK